MPNEWFWSGVACKSSFSSKTVKSAKYPLDVTPVFEHETVCGGARHFPDGFGHGISQTFERVLKEFWEAVVDRRILHTVIFNPGIRHIIAVVIFLEISDDFHCSVWSHINTALEVRLPAKLEIHIQVAFSVFFGQLGHGFPFILFITRPDIGDFNIIPTKA